MINLDQRRKLVLFQFPFPPNTIDSQSKLMTPMLFAYRVVSPNGSVFDTTISYILKTILTVNGSIKGNVGLNFLYASKSISRVISCSGPAWTNYVN